MQTIAEALNDPTVRNWYLAFCLALLVVPMAALSAWYHLTIRKSAGGRDLMKRQAMNLPTPDAVEHNLRAAGRMARDIAAGRHGTFARRTQNRTYVVVAIWLVVNAIAIGILIWADEINRETPLSRHLAPYERFPFSTFAD